MGHTVSLYVNMTFKYKIVGVIRQNHRAIKYRSHNSKIRLVCVEVLRPSQPNGVTSSVVNLPNHTFTGQFVSIVHILSPETDKCPS